MKFSEEDFIKKILVIGEEKSDVVRKIIKDAKEENPFLKILMFDNSRYLEVGKEICYESDLSTYSRDNIFITKSEKLFKNIVERVSKMKEEVLFIINGDSDIKTEGRTILISSDLKCENPREHTIILTDTKVKCIKKIEDAFQTKIKKEELNRFEFLTSKSFFKKETIEFKETIL